MSDIVDRLRDQGKDAFARQYSLGMFKLCTEAADEIEQLREQNERYRKALQIISGSADWLVSRQAASALDNIGPSVEPFPE